MNIISYSREQIQEELAHARTKHRETNDHIRLIFAPTRINHDNFERACDIYSHIEPENYDTVVVIESFPKVLDKKLPMPSNKFFETPLGRVPVNDFLRNELCDEDDDFYINDEGYSRDMSLYQQLMILQCVCSDFSVLSIQIADNDPAIIKELAYVLEEVLASHNALLVFCCDLENSRKHEFQKVKEIVESENESRLMNYLNSGESKITGTTSFIAGVLVAFAWDLKLSFLNGEYEEYDGSLLTGYADRESIIRNV
ncbi:AmmeMemoRadiSam system protein B [Aliifodinibius sp. S!AR15-10]|uniref:AmmeMemoRadiSam system protein B n=1 Tax=Aliifodinibius sp. S!AR15-10 TaxID=2950437 RepID=UPI00285894E7|nr:AmmeMemoRadiSam system protein B [Aliifodinibius sp. S!AR15-10]MDR8391784.1 AmmeMemoRadiSam system protein B [Aliifodinibius sp. S!AR15-10]